MRLAPLYLLSASAGIFFFTLALFGFSCLSSLSLFANERILFMRERLAISFLKVSRLILTCWQSKRLLFSADLLLREGAL